MDTTLISEFKDGMRRLASGVSLIATTNSDRDYGMAATAVTLLTAEPPTLLICLNRQASLHGPLLKSLRFSVNVLSERHAALLGIFSDPARRDTRFESGDWHRTHGLPVLHGAQVAFICETTKQTNAGSHVVIFGQVTGVLELSPEATPLVWYRGGSHNLGTIE